MARPPSAADRDFSKRLQALGIDAPPELVQTLREVGLLPRPTPIYPGGGGSAGRYPSGLIERAREAVDLAREHHRQLHFAVAIMYARGTYRITETKLRRALRRTIQRYRDDLHRAAGDTQRERSADDVAIDAGVVLAKRIARDPEFAAIRRRVPRSKDRPKLAVLETFATGIVGAHLTGDKPAQEAIDAIIQMSGAQETFGAQLASQLGEHFDPADFANLRLDDTVAALKQADLTQLERARDDALLQADSRRALADAFEYFFEISPGEFTFPDSDEATLVWSFRNVTAIYNSPADYEREIDSVTRGIPALRAVTTYGEFLPPEFRSLLSLVNPLAEADLTSGQHERLQSIKLAFVHSNPDAARLLAIDLK